MTYTVRTLRSGQPRAYSDHETEYEIEARYTPDFGPHREPKAWWPVYAGTDEADREARERAWCKAVVRALCQSFREPGDPDGGDPMRAHFAPTLRSLTWDRDNGTIRALVTSAYTD